MTERNRPDRALVERVVREEADRIGVDLTAVLSGLGAKDVREARGRAMRRIFRESGCNVSGLADAWGCDRATVTAYCADLVRPEPRPYDERTKHQLRWLYPSRAEGIIAGRDALTNRDLAAWRRLGRRAAA